jgi:hypothetical protein
MLLLRASGEVETYPPQDLAGFPAEEFRLKELQVAVGGYIEMIMLNEHSWLIVNEEGRMEGLELNVLASRLAGQEIVGDVLFALDSMLDSDDEDDEEDEE